MTSAVAARETIVGEARRYCLVTATHPSNDPRLVKAADALCDAGHHVTVVGLDMQSEFAERDRSIVESRGWALIPVRARRQGGPALGRWRWMSCAIVQQAARKARAADIGGAAVRDQALSRYVVPLTQAVLRVPADVYVAHTLEALPAAARAASRRDALLAFDVEDLHSAQLPDDAEHAAESKLRFEVEQDYLPRCDRVLAASYGIAEELQRLHGVANPTVVLNVFPAANGRAPVQRETRREAPSLYWFSQVIGPHRGLEDAVAALAQLQTPVTLHLRGGADSEYLRYLLAMAERLGVAERVVVHATVHPDELIRVASEYDIGLALETGFSRNNEIATSNKVFSYMLAGLAIVASDIRGHRDVLADAPQAAVLYRRRDARDLARALSAIISDPERLSSMRRASYQLAIDRYSWELEQPKLLEALTFNEARRERARSLQ